MNFRIATWNLDHASTKSRPVLRQLEAIRAIDADIWVLTETCDRVDLKPDGFQFATPFTRNVHGNFWTTIWLRKPFTISERIHSYDDETNTCVVVTSPTGRFLLYGTIIPYAMHRVSEGGPKKWEEHHKEIDALGAEWLKFQATHELPIVIAGDFNQARDGVGRYFSREGVQMLSEWLLRNGLTCATEEDFGQAGKLSMGPGMNAYRHNIDHICLTSSMFDVLQTGAWDHFFNATELTDHNGVYVDLSIRLNASKRVANFDHG